MDDPFIFIKKIFIDYGYSKPLNYYNRLVFIFHTCSLTLESYFMLKNFSLDFFTKYGCALILSHYLLLSQFVTLLNKELIKELIDKRGRFFWTIDSSAPSVKNQILKKSLKFNRKYYFVLFWFVALEVTLLPIWGDLNETHLSPQVYKTYFETWSPFFYYFYVFSFPLLAYHGIGFPATVFYFILQLDLQKILLTDMVLRIPDSGQEAIYENMCLCISQDKKLKKWIARIQYLLKKLMALYICVAFLCLISVIFFILSNLTNSRSILAKSRFFCAGMAGGVVLYTFCESGQLLMDYTEDVFSTLTQCPWYGWNTKNRKLYVMFMQNTQKPLIINWGSVTLNYSFGGSVIKNCCSYALVFYKLRNGQ
ncbi:odorant receptor 185 [Tribolium castaneum]|uniref:Odorant receptor n=1 Tax=Tribolium castaneum TaxID=7070 RepID=D6WEP3_TRICA|nr:odorant receptor 185 [Tribolium castaneum]